MRSMAGVLARVPLYRLFRSRGWPRMLPMSLTLSPSPRCNSRCLTCNIWMKREDELTLDEWDRTLRSLGTAPFWVTISGGEPFLYSGLVELATLVHRHCRPGVINIPTNALLASVPERVEQIARACPDSRLVINLSLDGVGRDHDRLRGVEGNFEKLGRCLEQLLVLRERLPNLTVGIHSVISRFNVNRVGELIAFADRSGADQFITEIAEPRVELDTVGQPITPSPEQYALAAEQLVAHLRSRRSRRLSAITEAFRLEYYDLVQRTLGEADQVIPCYAGWASAHIYSDGTVWPCCVRADDVGALREVDYDFSRIWFGEKLAAVRRSIAAKECHCPLANAAYTNMLHDLPTLSRVGRNLAASAATLG